MWRKPWVARTALIFLSALLLGGVLHIYLRGRPMPCPLSGEEDDAASLMQALESSIAYLRQTDPGKTEVLLGREVAADELLMTLQQFAEHLKNRGASGLQEYAVRNFEIIESESVKATGYFQPRLRGSLKASERYSYPIYRRPPPEQREFSREDIDYNGVLRGRGLELAWVDDPIALFFLHVQGSGVIQLDDNSEMLVQYDGDNGKPYRAIGSLLMRDGLLEPGKVSMQSIKRHLQRHPGDRRRILSHNPRYIFFRPESRGPLGSLGFPLTPFRSIACDFAVYPRGGLALLTSSVPVFDRGGRVIARRKFSRFVLCQDSGSAIKGPERIDLFTGQGEISALIAGQLNEQARLSFLLARQPLQGELP